MNRKDFETQYQHALQNYQSCLLKSNQLSVIRFLLFSIILLSILIGYFYDISFMYFISLISIVIFIYCVSLHTKQKKKLLYYDSLQYVYHRHLQRMNNEWDQWEDDGQEFIDDNISIDLDLFGHHSLFQFLNTTFTYQGKSLLAHDIKNHSLSLEDIAKRQEALKELSHHEHMFIELQTYGRMTTGKDEHMIQSYIQSISSFQKSSLPVFLFIFPIITVIALIFTLFNIAIPYSSLLLEIGVVVQLMITFLFIKQNIQLFQPIVNLEKGLKSFEHLFSIIENESFQSSLLLEIQNDIVQYEALKGIQELEKIAQGVRYRQNIFFFLIFNGVGLYDLILRNRYLKWIKQYGHVIEKWFEALSRMEVLMSLYAPKMDGFYTNQPQLVDEISLTFENLCHPLIHSDKAIGNSFELKKKICVITGSNMSGKTTFMRTIALNLVLAYMGGYIFGKSMICSYMNIMTSMRVKDNVEEGISTFYGELLRIKDMIQYSQKKLPMICFIDEIFKGTNSLDRIAGARATIQKLSLNHCIIFMTTHDFELCQCDSIDMENYHFCEYYQDDKIYFDYLIHSGQAQTTNGQFLLKQLGII